MDLFDFANIRDLSDWEESSDTVRTVGMSKASLTLQVTQIFQRAVIFFLLNPQPNGAGFAGVRTKCDFDLQAYSSIRVRVRGQGMFDTFKVTLRHNNEWEDGSFEQTFRVNIKSRSFEEVDLPLKDFHFYFRGRIIPDHEELNVKNITDFGFQAFGGVYEHFKQSGVSSLEVDWVKAL